MKKIIKLNSKLLQIATIYICILFSINLQAQNNWITLPNGETITSDNNESVIYYYENRNGEHKIRKLEGPKEVVKIIVTLKEKPLALYKSEDALQKASLTSVQSSLEQTHSTVVRKIENIANQLLAGANVQYDYKINREYYTALNGIAMECNQAMIQYIRELPEVEDVTLDRQVKAYLTQSIKQIRADIVRDSLGYTGKGILIGVIDTGIDYFHPALGGGYGSGYRVIGGYDFVNNDSSPYDDEGHGTHVAGIIGANGNSDQIGVAPNVNFLAVKVLDYNGMGYTSDIVAGIEYCMDPDGNPGTDDAVDIINLSLGGTAETDNPMDAAIDNATRIGVLSVIAAGNMGEFPFVDGSIYPYQMIGSPGTAETALTVGACTFYDRLASFSSKGPDPLHFAIKPEVIAPGMDILSLSPNNQMATLSGTSMATPHVVGLAALLKEQHPDWTPGQIKAAIINTANPIIESLFGQGNGRVDALDAATIGVLVEPGVASFGLVDLNEPVWKDTVELRIKNLRNASQHFELEKEGFLPPAVELNLSQTSFDLAPMEQKEITVIISVPQSVPVKPNQPFAYTGNIICQSDSDRVQIPFCFLKSCVLKTEGDIGPQIISLYYGPNASAGVINVDLRIFGKNLILTVPPNTYLLWTETWDYDTINQRQNHYFIVWDSIKVVGLTNVSVSRSDAKFEAFYGVDKLRDVYDNPVPQDSIRYGLQIDFNNGLVRTIFSGQQYKDNRYFLNSLDKRFLISQEIFKNNGEQTIFLSNSNSGIHSQDDLTFLSGSQNLGDIHLNFDYLKRINRGPFLQSNSIEVLEDIFEGGGILASGYLLPQRNNVHLMTNKLTEEFNPMQYSSIMIGVGTYGSGSLGGDGLPYIRTGTTDFYIDQNRDFVFFDRKFFRPDQEEYVKIMTPSSGDTVYISENVDEDVVIPKTQYLYQYYNPKDLGLVVFSPDGNDDGGISWSNGIRYYGGHTIIMQHPVLYTQMYSRNRLQPKNYMPSYNYMYYFDYTVEKNANRYRLLSNTRLYNLLGQNGKSTVDYEFNVTEPATFGKCFMPSLDLFQILENGKYAKWLHPGQDKKVRLVIFDPKENVDSVSIYLLKNDGSEIELTTTQASQREYLATIPEGIPDGFLDVIARVHNTEGNQFELTVSPAFYSGSTIDSSYTDARLQMTAQTMDNVDSVEFIAGDTLKYTLTFINYGNRVAEDITVNFPETEYFMPVGNTSIHLDSMSVDVDGSDYKYEIPLNLVFLGKQQQDEKQCYYYPTITWKSGERTFTRKNKILVDFESTPTNFWSLENSIPETYVLSQNYPNPFNPTTRIRYSIPENTHMSLKVYNLLGEEVKTLFDGERLPGNYIVTLNGDGLASGVYLYQLKAENYIETKKLVLLK